MWSTRILAGFIPIFGSSDATIGPTIDRSVACCRSVYMGEESGPTVVSALGAPVSLIRGGKDGLRVADEGVRCVLRGCFEPMPLGT